MTLAQHRYALIGVIASLWIASAVIAAEPKTEFESFNPKNFDRSTVIDNKWFPIKPGMRYIWDGYAVDEEGIEESISVAFTVTDLTKVIDGVRTVVCWDRDIVDRELEESEILFLAQDKEGAVWLMGEYPEEYDDDDFIGAPCWIHGVADAKAGIIMPAEPKPGSRSYSQGWAPAVEFTDRAVVYQVGQKTEVPFGSFDDVLVIDESNNEEPNAHQLKFYARSIGCIRIGWRGEVTDQEEMQLIKVEQLSDEEMAKAREAAFKLEKRAYEISKDVYGKTEPSEHNRSSQAGSTQPDARSSVGE